MHIDWQAETMRYCEENSSSEPSFLTDLIRFTWLNTVNPRQASGHLQGRFLSFLSKIVRPESILEVGTFTGYATLCLAEGLKNNGIIHTIEADEETVFKAKSALMAHPGFEKIIFHTGNALEIIPQLAIQPNIVFVDADKQSYEKYFELCLPMIAENGIMLFDNTLWSGKVIQEKERLTDEDTKTMHRFNQMLAAEPTVEVTLLPLRDGLTLVRKK